MFNFKLSAVGYLNPVPLVWGMLHGPQRSHVDLRFSVPSECAQQVEEGEAELGLVPVAEIARQSLEIVPGVGIACLGAVRSILLFAKRPWQGVQSVAVDCCSRTSVQLARVILREKFGVEPELVPHPPNLEQMMKTADAALVIGDPALRIDPLALSYECLDLGHEWFALTGLPMVFATWAGKPGLPLEAISKITVGSYHFGRERLAEIARLEHDKRGITYELAHRYLSRHIRYELGPRELLGLTTFLELADFRPASLAAMSSCND